MQRAIYIDSVFLSNFIMDILLLSLTVRTMKKQTAFRKILAGSLVGATGYCLLLCLPGSYTFKVIFGFFPVTAIMLRVACNAGGLKEILYGMGCLFTYSFLLGGFLIFLIKKLPPLRAGTELWKLLFTGCLGFLICTFVISRFRKKKENPFRIIELPGDKGEFKVCGLIDTGNGLKEPISGKETAILEEKVWENMQNCKRPEKYRLIPFHSIGKEKGMLEGYEVEKIRIEEESGCRELKNVMIAVFKGKISAKGDYQMILPPQWF